MIQQAAPHPSEYDGDTLGTVLLRPGGVKHSAQWPR